MKKLLITLGVLCTLITTNIYGIVQNAPHPFSVAHDKSEYVGQVISTHISNNRRVAMYISPTGTIEKMYLAKTKVLEHGRTKEHEFAGLNGMYIYRDACCVDPDITHYIVVRKIAESLSNIKRESQI
ncbi:MAG: hypothetical protein ACRC5M_06430 [Anaeroplasmataceae bacterium]